MLCLVAKAFGGLVEVFRKGIEDAPLGVVEAGGVDGAA